MTVRSDIVIAGGGMVGVSLALQLGASLPAQTRITLVESFELPDPDSDPLSRYHPSFDVRSTALSYSSRQIYSRLGIWDRLEQRCAPIETIHVSTRGRFGSTVMSAADHQWEALGYVIENGWLGNVLVQALHDMGRVELIAPASVVDANFEEDGLRLSVEGREEPLETDLLVVADGAGSVLRDRLGIAALEKPYEQCALVANVATAQPHAGCAFERFTDEGPLALLPLLPGPAGEQRSALVWTLPPERAQQLQDCPDAEFLASLQDRFGYRLGRLLQVGQRSAYPLALVQAQEQVRRHAVVMGNAAHALHPVAGQGFNLALRDIASLAAVLAEGLAQGDCVGDLHLLDRYRARQAADQAQTIAFSDRVPGLFMQSDPLLGLGRDLALAGMDIFKPLKGAFVRHAAGMAHGAGASHA